ncbi:MAG: hypothetical protein AAB415_01510 [Patescibacteria group bacterium]
MSHLGVGYTGHLFEEEVLGTGWASWDLRNYVPFDEALTLVRSHQNWNPSDPTTRRANDLHAEVALALELENWQELCFFSALKSPLDFFHGVDGFFEFRGRVVTIDLTTNPHKDRAKARFVLHPADLAEDRPATAKMIARALLAERRSA